MQPISFKPFAPPAREPIFALKSVAFEFLNILTLGIYGAAEGVSKQHRVKKLQLVQEDLKIQAATLMTNWSNLEKQLTFLLDDLRTADENDPERVKNRFNQLIANKEKQQSADSIKSNVELAMTLSEVVLGTIFFVGYLIANILTVGAYGVYQNYTLKNRIIYLTAENDQIQSGFDAQKKEKFENLQKIADAIEDFSTMAIENNSLNTKLEALLETDEGKAALDAYQAKNDLAALEKQHIALQNDVLALKTQQAIVENAKKQAESELAAKKQQLKILEDVVAEFNDNEILLTKERDRLKLDVDKKDKELAAERAQKKRDLADLQVKLNNANAKAAQVQALQAEIDKLNVANDLRPEAIKLHAQLGPIAPKYTPVKPEGETTGAMDIDKIRSTLTPEQIQYAEGYNQRYGDKYDANRVVEAGFEYAFKSLVEMGKKGDKIKLNDSEATAYGRGAHAVYRFMVLDILKGGKVTSNGCHGFKLSINDDIHLLPSQPERVMQFKKDDATGNLKPEVRIAYKQHDNFTPDEDTLATRDGVDAVSAKWILEQLSDEETEYLITHLMDPVIENRHPDYQKMKVFMQNSKDPRVKLVMTASDLIQDMATALHKKFGKTTFAHLWITNACGDQDPFVKADDVAPDMTKIIDDEMIRTDQGAQFVDWEMDKDVVADKRYYHHLQEDFYDKMIMTKLKYTNLFEHLDKKMIRHPEKNPGPIKKVTWAMVNKQYRHCHQMIGVDVYGNGGQRCLFSNLLAVLMSDEADLTVENVYKLKNAMASYLDKIQKAKNQWDLEQVKPAHLQSKDAKKLKELADQAGIFENGIKKTHGCSVTAYQAWLRGDAWGAANINISNLTPFEIQLAAHTLGIRIGLLPIDLTSPAIIDDLGRILPEGEFYGPNTKEFFLMGVIDPDGKGGTFYGLYPKLEIEEDQLDQDVFEDLSHLENYWNAINLNTDKT